MIKLSEVVQGIEDINKSFQKKQDAEAEIKYLHDRLLAEVRGKFTDVDQTLIELRLNIAKYLAETDVMSEDAQLFFKVEVVDKLTKDFDDAGITRLSELAQRLRRLRWK